MWRPALLVAFAFAAQGCGTTCGALANEPPAAGVEVFDAVTGAPICNATVTLVSDIDKEVLGQGWWNGEAGVPPEGGAPCPYRGGLGSNTGHFTLIASAPGYQTQQKQVAVGKLVGCGTIHATRNVTFKLEPQ